MSTITLYHGTSQENYEQIMKDGVITGRVYFTPRKDMAREYGEVVIAVDVEISLIKIDWESTDYNPEMTIEQAIEEGLSLYVDDDVMVV